MLIILIENAFYIQRWSSSLQYWCWRHICYNKRHKYKYFKSTTTTLRVKSIISLRYILFFNNHIFRSESSNINVGTQIREHEETTKLSPSLVRKTTIYESRRTLDTEQPVLGVTSTGFRTHSPVSSSSHIQQETTDEQQIEEKYEVTLSSYDESGLKILSSESMMTPSTTGEG